MKKKQLKKEAEKIKLSNTNYWKLVTIVLAILILGLIFYQSYADKKRIYNSYGLNISIENLDHILNVTAIDKIPLICSIEINYTTPPPCWLWDRKNNKAVQLPVK